MFDKKVIDVIRFEKKKMMDEFLYQSWPDICVRKSDGLWQGWDGVQVYVWGGSLLFNRIDVFLRTFICANLIKKTLFLSL